MINNKNIYTILEGKYSTEKTVNLADKNNSITFLVSTYSNKYDIKHAVENLFKVSVLSINIMNMKGKKIRYKSFIGKKKNWKKAIVKLKKGYNIKTSEFK